MPNTLAYGFTGLAHLMNERINARGAQVVWDAVAESARYHNTQVEELLSSFVFRTTLHTERFSLPGQGTLQPLDEWGNPLPVKEAGSYDVAYPIKGGGTAWGTNRVTSQLMTVEEANRHTLEALKRDRDWLRRHILAAVLTNTAYTHVDPEFGALVVEPLANGDAVTYVRKQTGVAATDDHYLAQAGAIADATNPFPGIYNELMEHPSNEGPVVVYVPTNNVAAVQGLAGFTPVFDPDLNPSVVSTTLRREIGAGVGYEVLGKVDRCWVVEWPALPDDYLVAHAVGAGPFVAMREYPAAGLQGLFVENHSPDGNRQEMRLIRYCGFGVRNRVAALVQRVGNAAYAIPAGFQAPLAV